MLRTGGAVVPPRYAPSPGEVNNPGVGAGGFSNPAAVPTPKPAAPSNPFVSDPGYSAALAQEQLGISQNNAALNNLIAQRIISYGDPGLASMAGFGLDPQAAAFAKQNYLSGNGQLARIDRQHQLNLQAIINRLAGHGLLDSGETGYQTGQEDQGYGNTVYDAQQQALADILGYRQQTLQQNRSLQDAVVQALQQAYQNYLNHPELGGYGAPIGQPNVGGQPSGSAIRSVAKQLTAKPAVGRALKAGIR